MNPRCAIVPLLLAPFAPVALAQMILPDSSSPMCAVIPKATYLDTPLKYPMTSDRYAVQYKVGLGDWTDAQVYISYYGGTNSSPAVNYQTGYTGLETSMSFVSIPASAGAFVQLRVTRLGGSGFKPSDHVSVRPGAKAIPVYLASDGTAQLFTWTGWNFKGDQFLLWWGDGTNGAATEGLAFFLDPQYAPPTGGNVLPLSGVISADLDPAAGIDTLAFQGVVTVGTGAKALLVPPGIRNIYFAPDSWVQGKLRFQQSGGNLRKVYGPGVLDVSRFEYDLRVCRGGSGYADQGYEAITYETPSAGQVPDTFLLDGIVITDHNHATTDPLINSTVNNVKTMSWNAVNGGIVFGSNTNVSNVFVRAGDDSLMVWGSYINITNATVWQNYNGGVVNLGWLDNSPGENCLIDGLYVVKTDWLTPTDPTFSMTGPDFSLNNQNNAVIASMMVPGTMFGMMQPSLFKNVFVEDPPPVLFSLKILPPDCDLVSFEGAGCPVPINLMQSSVLNLNIENLFTPPSIEENSIGFETLINYPNAGPALPSKYTLMGSMKINLTNVFFVGKVVTNGDNVNVRYVP
ncbi:MAG: hypothetical protein ABSG41_16530 [Bryobacteraceae bacterium]|jgi:hypothetical protein